ncbi:MAG TPA: hypothetical protein VKN99_07440 [Polyangia bacterium]|nr:hypothetical protein [Polyangia bacterium]
MIRELMALLVLVVVGCGDANHPGTPAGNAALVALTDYMTPGHAARIDLHSFAVTDNVLALGEDSALKAVGDRLFVINEFGATDADNVAAFAMAGLRAMGMQTSTGRGSDPQDLVVGPDGKLYLAELEGPGIAVVNPEVTSMIGEISLSSLDPDGKPNLVAIYRKGNLLYAFCALWDDTQQLKPPRGPGKIAIVDLATQAMVGSIDMMAQNPAGWVHEEPGTPNVLVAAVEDYSGQKGGIERVDLQARVSRGLMVTAQALGGRYVSDFLVTASGDGFLSAVDPASTEGASNLHSFTLGGQVSPPVLSGHAAGLALDPLNRLWVVDRGYGASAATQSGLRVVDLATRRELSAQPIHTSLPPRFWGGIVFVP